MKCVRCDTPISEGFRYCPKCGADTSKPDADMPTQVMASADLGNRLKAELGERYEVHGMVGRGGMGAVFEATDRKLNRTVAIKVLPPDYAESEQVRERFMREAQTAAKLDHVNIVPIYAVEDEGDLHYFVMKFVDGHPLDKDLESGPVKWQDAQRILWEAAAGLGHAHSRGIIHRDIKPGNIMIDADNRALLADFGISKAQEATTKFTATGAVIGTPAYMSPEQAKTVEVDGRSDQYSLGMVGYRMLAGRVAFESDSVHSLIYQHVFEPPPPLADLCPDAPAYLVKAIERALSKKPEERFQTMDEFAAAVWPERGSPSQSHVTLRGGAPADDLSDQVTLLTGDASGRDAPVPTEATAGSGYFARAKLRWTGLLVVVFIVNLIQTALETCCKRADTVTLGFEVSAALHQIERQLQFINHDLTNALAVYGYSISYFFLLPVLGVTVAVFAWRNGLRSYRGLVLAVAITYALSLPFFMFFPVPERWTYPDAGAILLSDLWSSALIEAIRPISALDNSFPSFHTSLSVVLSTTCFVYALPLRWTILFLSGTIIFATFALGIHWLPDLIAGVSLGVLAVALAARAQDRWFADPERGGNRTAQSKQRA